MAANNPYVPELERVFKELIEVLSAHTEEQLNTIPFEGSWTAGQVGDHLLKSYGVAETLNGRTAQTTRPIDAMVERIKAVFLDFSTKLKSPEFIIPTNDHIHKEQLLKDLSAKTSQILQVLKTRDLTETCLDFEPPVLGKLTRLEWACFVYCHTTRHIHQLKKINHFINNQVHIQENSGGNV